MKIGSASSWNKVTLTLFHVGLYRNKFSDLQGFLGAKCLQPPTRHEACHEGNSFDNRGSRDVMTQVRFVNFDY